MYLLISLLLFISGVSIITARYFWKKYITINECIWGFIITAGLVALSVFVVSSIDKQHRGKDHEVWNGEVVNKQKVKVSCEHSYSCNCVAVQVNKTQTIVCQTCYEHDFDYAWRVYSNVGSVDIETIDRQGVNEPRRFTEVQVGEPFSIVKSFKNYLLLSDDTLFARAAIKEYKEYLPKYPIKIYDYYHINRVITTKGVTIPNINKWNKDLSVLLKTLGPKKKANIVIVFTNVKSRKFAKALQAYWHGAKKNDIVIVVSTKKYPEIGYVEVFSWAKKNIFNVTLRDTLEGLHTIDRVKFMQTIEDVTLKYYQKRSLEEFKYLEKENKLSTTAYVVIFLIGVLINGGVIFYTKMNLTREW